MATTSASISAAGRFGFSLFLPAFLGAFALIAIAVAPGLALAEKRVALVIGNSEYENAAELANPANDATDIGVALRDLGFDVVVGIDLDNRGMRDKVREFGSALRGADVAMLFYAGHAMQVNGRNYLAPIDTRLEYESDLDFETIPLQFIQRQMEREAKTQLIFIDACRDNPLTRSFQAASRSNGAGKGLAEEKLATSGILIAFGTSPDRVALDGTGRNSPFTRALLDHIRRPGIEISTLMTDVRVQVREQTNGEQIPWINSALLGRFYFNPAGTQADTAKSGSGENSAASENSQQVANLSSSPEVEKARIEALAWEAVQDSENVAELEAFIATYGDGFYGKLAQIRIDRIKGKRQGNAVAANPPENEGEPQTPKIETASLEQPKEEETRAIEPQIDTARLTRDIQNELARLNCDPGRADGIWGKRSRSALERFERATKESLSASDPTPTLLTQLQEFKGGGCPKIARKTTPKRQASTPPDTATRSVSQQPQTQQRFVVEQPQPGTAVQQPGTFVQQPGVVVQQPGGVIVQEPGVVVQQPGVIVQQPQPGPNPAGHIFGGAVIGGALACIVSGC
jgi:Caspase domain